MIFIITLTWLEKSVLIIIAYVQCISLLVLILDWLLICSYRRANWLLLKKWTLRNDSFWWYCFFTVLLIKQRRSSLVVVAILLANWTELENETKQEDGYHLEFGSTSKKAVIIKPTLNKLFVLKEEIQKLFSIDIAKDCLEQVLYTCIEKDVDSDLMNRHRQVRLEQGEFKLEPQF